MKNDWILGVLTDLICFARENGMDVLAEHLEESQLVAAIELTAPKKGMPSHDAGTAVAAGFVAKRVGERL